MSQSDNSVFVIYKRGASEVDQISKNLNLNPDKVSVANEQSSNSVWKMLCRDKDSDLEEQLEHWISLLENKADILQKLRAEGWSVELDCLIQPDDGAAIIIFEPQLLNNISNLNISLKIRFWE